MDINFSQKWRANDKFSISMGISYQPRFNNVGFSTISDGKTIFAKRHICTYVNSLSAKYNFTNRMGLTITGRHYMRSIENELLFNLNQDGTLVKNDLSANANDKSVNFFNIDMVYTWQIAQGSFINVVWKNAINRFDDKYESSYFRNLKDSLKEDQNNNLSIKVIYFLDYNTIFPSF